LPAVKSVVPSSLFDVQEMAIAERLFLPPPKENAESDKKAGVRVSRRILKQQQERIAAEKIEGTDSSSHE
jgi:hypothetical protein